MACGGRFGREGWESAVVVCREAMTCGEGGAAGWWRREGSRGRGGWTWSRGGMDSMFVVGQGRPHPVFLGLLGHIAWKFAAPRFLATSSCRPATCLLCGNDTPSRPIPPQYVLPLPFMWHAPKGLPTRGAPEVSQLSLTWHFALEKSPFSCFSP